MTYLSMRPAIIFMRGTALGRVANLVVVDDEGVKNPSTRVSGKSRRRRRPRSSDGLHVMIILGLVGGLVSYSLSQQGPSTGPESKGKT